MTHQAPIDDDLNLEISPKEVAELLAAKADMLLLDCRRPDEYELTHIEGATLVPMQELSLHLDELQPHANKPIVVYCRTGKRSLTVTLALRDHGFTNVRSMAGGIHRWSQEIDPSIPQY